MKAKASKKFVPAKTSNGLNRPEQPIIAFASAMEFSLWLDQNHADHPGIWMRIYKKDTGHPTVTYAEALEAALCYGWIDGQKKRGDDISWLQKFTRRGPRSIWSKINVGHVERLIREGRMKPSGIAAVEAAKADGRWERAYSSSKTAELPPEFVRALEQSPKAAAFFGTLNRANRYAFCFRLQTIKKPETRAKRLKEFIAMLEQGEKWH